MLFAALATRRLPAQGADPGAARAAADAAPPAAGGAAPSEGTAGAASPAATAPAAVDTKKHYLAAVGGMLLADGVVFLLDKFVLNLDWSKGISFDTIRRNLTSAPSFDVNWSGTNFIGHPYQGALSYLAGRNSRLNVFESFILSAAGSAIWEYFCENTPPSLNDLIYTPVGGFVLGEMLYRLSLEAEGRGHTVLSFFANPMRLYTDPVLRRGLRGASGRLRDFSIRAGYGFSFGATWRGAGVQKELFPFYGAFGWRALYGDPYDNDSNTPFSQFELQMDLAAGFGSGRGAGEINKALMYNISLFSDGTIISRNVGQGGAADTTLSMSVEYDFVCRSFAEFSTLAPGFAAKQRIKLRAGELSWQSRAAVILLGSQDFYFMRRGMYEGETEGYRDYGYTCGAELVEKLSYKTARGFTFDWTVRGYAMYSYSTRTAFDDQGWALFAYSEMSAEAPLSGRCSFGVSQDIFVKGSLYDRESDAFQALSAVRLYVRISFV